MGTQFPNFNFIDVLQVPTVAKLATASAVNADTLAWVQGRSEAADGGQAFYMAVEGSTLTADGDQIVAVTDENGDIVSGLQWIKVIPGGISPAKGTLGTAVSGTIAVDHDVGGALIASTFTLTAAQIPVTDAAGSGSHGGLLLYTLPEGAVIFHGCRQNYTAFAEDAALTADSGDAVFDIGVGSVIIAAPADGALTSTDDDIGDEVGPLTMSGGTGTGAGFVATQLVFDGTAAAGSINLNLSATAATIEASGEIDVTGTITVLWSMVGDD
jgi:hypothetical protein